METNLEDAIQGCKPATPNKVWIGFAFVNDAGVRVRQRQVRLSVLYKDWYGECSMCPPNDAVITSVNMRTDVGKLRFDLPDGDLQFGAFMDALEKNWKFQRIQAGTDRAT